MKKQASQFSAVPGLWHHYNEANIEGWEYLKTKH